MIPLKPEITIKDLEKLDIRVGTITEVTDIKESDKLVVLDVDFGDFTRKIIVGMKKERKDPTEVKGKQALFVVNLAPREMYGIVSQGMQFDIGYTNGIIPVLAMPEKPVPKGSCAG